MKLKNILLTLFISLAACTSMPKHGQNEEYRDRNILYMSDFNCPCNILQGDFLLLFDDGHYESSFVDYGTRASYHVGKWKLDDIPVHGPAIEIPLVREAGATEWYTSIEFISFGDKCSVSVREINYINDKILNGQNIIELLRQLER